MALLARERDGFGQIIEAPLFDSTFQAIGVRSMKFHDQNLTPQATAWMRQYECADGRWVQIYGHDTRWWTRRASPNGRTKG